VVDLLGRDIYRWIGDLALSYSNATTGGAIGWCEIAICSPFASGLRHGVDVMALPLGKLIDEVSELQKSPRRWAHGPPQIYKDAGLLYLVKRGASQKFDTAIPRDTYYIS
jgi:hypothetical protein